MMADDHSQHAATESNAKDLDDSSYGQYDAVNLPILRSPEAQKTEIHPPINPLDDTHEQGLTDPLEAIENDDDFHVLSQKRQHPSKAKKGGKRVKHPSKPKKPQEAPPPLTPAQEAKQRRQKIMAEAWKKRTGELGRLILFAAIFYGVYLGFTHPVWIIQPDDIVITGNHMIRSERIMKELAPEIGKHLLLINPATVAERFQKDDPLIARLQVRRQIWPRFRLNVALSEHRPWGLVHNPWEKATVLAWHRKPDHDPEALIPPPYAFVLDSYKNLRFVGQKYRLPLRSLSQPSVLMFMDTQWYRTLPAEKRDNVLKDLDRAIEGLRQVEDINVESVSISRNLHLKMDATLYNTPVEVLAGPIGPRVFDRLARIKPTLVAIKDINDADKDAPIDRIDVRWNENVYLRRQNGETTLGETIHQPNKTPMTTQTE